MKIYSAKKNKGFTLVETLIAILIFSVSVLAIMAVLASGISNINFAKQKMTAGYLAQEGIEYMRNLRDSSVLASSSGWVDPFLSTLNNCNGEDSACNFDNSNPPFSCSDCYLYVNNKGYDTVASGTNSGFKRKIWINKIGNGSDQVQIFSEVIWTQGSGEKSITFSENLFNWME